MIAKLLLQNLIWIGTMAPLFAIRAGIEERTLIDGLPGYADYTAQVRYRLMPGLW
jgi:protein-S-isoprenylcysteine O-methyltransferase Ste14